MYDSTRGDPVLYQALLDSEQVAMKNLKAFLEVQSELLAVYKGALDKYYASVPKEYLMMEGGD